MLDFPPEEAEMSNVLIKTTEQPEVIELDWTHAAEICELEPRCYPSPWSSDLIRAEFCKEISFRLGLRYREKIVGYSFSYLLVPDLHLLNIAIDPDYRGLGFGRVLLCSLLTRAIDLDISKVFLEVRVSNTIAQNLYRQVGFLASGTRHGYYRDNGEDALLLELELKPESKELFHKLVQLG